MVRWHIMIRNKYPYLGQTVGANCAYSRKQTGMGWSILGKYSAIMNSNLLRSLKRKVHNYCILCLHVWFKKLAPETFRKLRSAKKEMKQKNVGCKRRERKGASWNMEQIKVKDILMTYKYNFSEIKWLSVLFLLLVEDIITALWTHHNWTVTRNSRREVKALWYCHADSLIRLPKAQLNTEEGKVVQLQVSDFIVIHCKPTK